MAPGGDTGENVAATGLQPLARGPLKLLPKCWECEAGYKRGMKGLEGRAIQPWAAYFHQPDFRVLDGHFQHEIGPVLLVVIDAGFSNDLKCHADNVFSMRRLDVVSKYLLEKGRKERKTCHTESESKACGGKIRGKGGTKSLAGGCLAPYLLPGKNVQEKNNLPDPLHGSVLYNFSLGGGELQQHLQEAKLLICSGS